MTTSDLRTLRGPCILVGAAAALFRLAFVFLGSSQQPLAEWVSLFPDSRLYLQSAHSIASVFDWNTDGVQMFGPGYPAWLAVWSLIVQKTEWILFAQLLLSCAGAALFVVLAFRLTGDRMVATLAGFIHAASLSAVSLACALLSDEIFFVALVAGLVVFEDASRHDRLVQAALAGLILGAAVLMRSAGWVIVVLLPLFALHHPGARSLTTFEALWEGRRVLGLTLITLLLVPACWALRNRAEYGVAYVSKAEAVAQVRMAAAIQSEVDGTSIESNLAVMGDSVVAEASASEAPDRVFLESASAHFWSRVRSHPGAAFRSYWRTMNDATHNDRGLWTVQLSRWETSIQWMLSWSDRLGLRYRALILSCAGLGILIAGRRYRMAVTLALTYTAFALVAGFSLWQGNRIFYPGQLAWTVLVAILIVSGWKKLRTAFT